MSDFSSMSRESKKDKLRRQIVSPQQPAWNAEPEEDSEAVVRRDLLPAQLPLFRL